jgi:hypothetical protein
MGDDNVEFAIVDIGGKFWRVSGETITSGPYVKRSDDMATDVVNVVYWFDAECEVREID